METLQIDVNGLRAVILAASKNDIRYYLNGALIEVKSGVVTLVATNGHMMHVYKQAETVEGEDVRIIVELADINLMLKSKPGKQVQLKFDRSGTSISIGKIIGEQIAAKYPDWRHIFKNDVDPCNVPGIAINPEYLSATAKALKILTLNAKWAFPEITSLDCGKKYLVQDKNVNNFSSVIMAVQDGKTEGGIYDWCKK